jgi:DNA-binding transcriptional MerR regulator
MQSDSIDLPGSGGPANIDSDSVTVIIMGVERTEGFSIDELAARAGVPVRTIRYYISEGLLPGPGARGKSAVYSEDHLRRLQLIRRLVEQRVPLAEIRARLALLSADDVRQVLAEEKMAAADTERITETGSAREYIAALLQRAQLLRRSAPVEQALPRPRGAQEPAVSPAQLWRRIELAPGVELHIRADAEERYHALLQRLLQVAVGSAGADDGLQDCAL